MVASQKVSYKKRFYVLLTALLIFMALLAALFATNLNMKQIRSELETSTKNYIDYEKEARNIERASDYLTAQTQSYVQTGDIQHVLLYFEEINITKRRQGSLERLQKQSNVESWAQHAKQAVQHSNELMETEFYAMKLTSAGYNHDYFDLPKEIVKITLTPEDAALSDEEKREKARLMVFDSKYHHKKAVIYEHITLFTRGILFSTENKLRDDLKSLSDAAFIQQILLAAVVIYIIVCYIMVLRFLYKRSN